MRHLAHALVLVALVTLAQGVGVTQSMAQECGSIVASCGPSLVHVFFEDSEQGGFAPEPVGFHGACLMCTVAGNPVSPDRCHDRDCDLSAAQQTAFNAIMEAASKADVPALLVAAERLPNRIRIHPIRRSVQVIACDGKTIVANVPLGNQYEFALSRFAAALGNVGAS